MPPFTVASHFSSSSSSCSPFSPTTTYSTFKFKPQPWIQNTDSSLGSNTRILAVDNFLTFHKTFSDFDYFDYSNSENRSVAEHSIKRTVEFLDFHQFSLLGGPCCFLPLLLRPPSGSMMRFLKSSRASTKKRRHKGDNPAEDSGTQTEDESASPSAEDIKSWSESFDKLMASNGRKVFREFLRSEYSEENMLFWLACEDLKRTENPDLVEEKARLIYEDYISILSPKEVSLDSRVREIINRNMVKPTPHTFDEAQLQIYTLMHRDSYPRFLNSQIYKNMNQ